VRFRKTPPEQGPVGRQRRSSTAGSSPAFSYYSSRASEGPRRMPPRGGESAEPAKPKQSRRSSSRSWLATTPFWLLVIVTMACGVKILSLSTDPKIVMVGTSSVASHYAHDPAAYAAAAHTLLASSLTNRSKLTVNLDGTARSLEHEFPELQMVSLSVPLIGSRPIVYVQVAQPSLVLQATGGNFAVNKTGLVLADVPSLPSGVPLVVDQSGATIRPGKQYLPSSTVAFIQTLAYQLSAAHLEVSTFVLPAGSPYEVDIRLEGKGYLVRTNLEADALAQSGVIIATLQQLGGKDPANYLDVRVPGRVYYK